MIKAILGHSEVSTVERYVHGLDVGVELDGLLPKGLIFKVDI